MFINVEFIIYLIFSYFSNKKNINIFYKRMLNFHSRKKTLLCFIKMLDYAYQLLLDYSRNIIQF